jgi:hypothetical protein
MIPQRFVPLFSQEPWATRISKAERETIFQNVEELHKVHTQVCQEPCAAIATVVVLMQVVLTDCGTTAGHL